MKNLKNKIKGNKGITLIALIITIIVLLILAGVAISMTLGSNGIIAKSQGAADAYQNAQEKEEIGIAKVANEIDTWTRTGQTNLKSNHIKSVSLQRQIKTASRITFQITINVDDENNYIGYHWFATKVSNTNEIKGNVEKGNSFTIGGLEANTKYKIIVYAYDINNNYCTSEEIIEETPSGELASDWTVGKYYKIGNDLFRTTGTDHLLLKDTYYGERANWETANTNAKAYKPTLNSKLMTLSQGQTMGNSAIVSGDVWWFEDDYGSDKCWCAQNGPYMWGWGAKTNTYGVRPCVTLPVDALVDGTGTSGDPYIVINY